MAAAKEIIRYISTSTKLALNLKQFARPSWVVVQAVIVAISTALAVFDTYTDWSVVLQFRETGFNNPLLPRNDHWIRAWFFFTFIGTLLTTISVLHDGIILIYSVYKCCKKRCCCISCKSSCCKRKRAYNPTTTTPDISEADSSDLVSNFQLLQEENENVQSNGEDMSVSERVEEENKNNENDGDDIPDPFKCCFRHGWNTTTRNETLGAITLWFHNVPMLTMSVLFALVQNSCKTPDPRNVTPILQSVGISTTAAVIASSWRLILSFARLYNSVGVRRKDLKWSKPLKQCFPKPIANEAAYPPNTCAEWCIIPFYCGMCMQFQAIAAAFGILFTIWLLYGLQKAGKNFDDSLGIYRISLTDEPDSELFRISGTIIPPNGTFTNLEMIPYTVLGQVYDVYCLSEFEYRSEESEIFFNAIEVIPLSSEGKFCDTRSGLSFENGCFYYYLYDNFVLYYASVDPTFGDIERFDQVCFAVKDVFGYRASPKVDLSINVSRHINRTGSPTSTEPLVVYYPNLNFSVLFSDILAAGPNGFELSTNFSVNNGTYRCMLRFYYDIDRLAVLYNYQGVQEDPHSGNCSCNRFSLFCFKHFHNKAVYGYLTDDSHVVQYIKCSSIPHDKIVPQVNFFLSITCPC